MNNNKVRYIIVGMVWLFIIMINLYIFYGVYAVMHLAASHSTGILSPPGGILRQIEFLYNASLIVVCLFCGLGIVRLR